METEIEIKFLFSSKFESELYEKINTHGFLSTKKQFLHNVYFDTADRSLRKMDMGLRVRSCDGRSVQTIKTAGRVIGGLHQRPEYNEPIDGLRPVLARFNDKIWPEKADIKSLENDLIPIFSTDFERQTWLVEMSDDTLIEVAYDGGFIETNQGKIDICEVELELIKGDQKKLFVLGNEFASLPSIRLGNVSKAQRGYMLIDNASFQVKTLLCSPIDVSTNIEDALIINVQHGLRHIQYHENCYVETHDAEALDELSKGIKFLHQNLKLFKPSLPSLLKADWVEDLHWLARSFSWLDTRQIYQNLLVDKGYYLRKLSNPKRLVKYIEEQDANLPEYIAICELLNSPRYCKFILKLTKWLILFEKGSLLNKENQSINDFAKGNLTDAWNALKASLSSEDIGEFSSAQGALESGLLVGLSVGNLFSQENSAAFRSPWLDIKQGMKEISMINFIADFSEQEDDLATKEAYSKWIKRKKDSLRHALEQSKQQALLKLPYWGELID